MLAGSEKSGGPGNHWLWPSCLAGGGEVDRGEAEVWAGSARMWRERRSGRSAGKRWRGGDRERERERTIAKKTGMGKG